MIFQRYKLHSKFKWLSQEKLPMIVSADYDGLICASFLNHYFNWNLEGFYNLNNIWISNKGINDKKNLIWVDLNILPQQGRAIGGHIISIPGEKIPIGFNTSCNPNIQNEIRSNEFNKKFPFSTLIYLLWMHNIKIKPNLFARMLVLHADASWLKFQHYKINCKRWQEIMIDYDWKWLFQKVDTKTFEKRIDQDLYPLLKTIGAISNKSKLKSNHLNISSQQYQFNPDWDEDVIINLFNIFAQYLGWTPPKLPIINKSIEGKRHKVPLTLVKQIGLQKFLNKNNIFSYAIPSPRIFNFTSFNKKNKSPIE